MKIHKSYIIFGLLLAFGIFFELAAHADENDQETKITFSEPFQIPGHILPAGTYVFEKADPDDNVNLVRVFSADGTVLEATLQTISAERIQPSNHTTITLANAEPGNPDYLLKWFYPGETIGYEFVYPKEQQRQIAQNQQQTLAASPTDASADTAGN